MNKRFLLHNSVNASCMFRDNEQITNVQPTWNCNQTKCTYKAYRYRISNPDNTTRTIFPQSIHKAFHSQHFMLFTQIVTIWTPESTQICYSRAYTSPCLFESMRSLFSNISSITVTTRQFSWKWKFSSVDRRGSTCLDHIIEQ